MQYEVLGWCTEAWFRCHRKHYMNETKGIVGLYPARIASPTLSLSLCRGRKQECLSFRNISQQLVQFGPSRLILIKLNQVWPSHLLVVLCQCFVLVKMIRLPLSINVKKLSLLPVLCTIQTIARCPK